jgi:hypothetical protein
MCLYVESILNQRVPLPTLWGILGPTHAFWLLLEYITVYQPTRIRHLEDLVGFHRIKPLRLLWSYLSEIARREFTYLSYILGTAVLRGDNRARTKDLPDMGGFPTGGRPWLPFPDRCFASTYEIINMINSSIAFPRSVICSVSINIASTSRGGSSNLTLTMDLEYVIHGLAPVDNYSSIVLSNLCILVLYWGSRFDAGPGDRRQPGGWGVARKSGDWSKETNWDDMSTFQRASITVIT